MKKMLLALGVLLLACACAPDTAFLYNWQGYSMARYRYEKGPSDQTLAAYKEQLAKIISAHKALGRPAPPGVCCEYGYLLLKQGDRAGAIEYFGLEEQAYPESAPFIARLKTLAEPAKEQAE